MSMARADNVGLPIPAGARMLCGAGGRLPLFGTLLLLTSP